MSIPIWIWRVIRAAKSAYYECAFNRHRFNIKNTWGVINEIISKSAKTKSFPDIFKDGQHELSDDQEIANWLMHSLQI